jgi:RNA-directed DNA polymerase
VVDADLKSYFDTIPKDRLLTLMADRVADRRILALVQSFLEQSVLEDAREWVPEQGTPQGAVVSPLLSNIYLNPLDHLMAGAGHEMVRYADDFVVLCRTAADAAGALSVVKDWTASAGLSLHPTKTRLVDANTDGFDLLGYHFEAGQRWPRNNSLAKFKDAVRAKTKRTTGRGLAMVIADLNPTLRGSSTTSTVESERLARWTVGYAVGCEACCANSRNYRGSPRYAVRIRWPNAFFADHGLFSLQEAHDTARQSP